MRQQRRLERDVAADPANHKTVQRLAHHGDGLATVFAMHDELGDHRVVIHRNLTAINHAGVHPHAVALRGVTLKHGLFWRRETHQAAGAGEKVAKRVFRVDAALDGPAFALHLVLRQWQRLTSRHADHQLDQIEPGDALGDRMLHLQAGVHLQEIKVLVLADHKLHRARALVLHRLGQRHRLLAHGFAGSF